MLKRKDTFNDAAQPPSQKAFTLPDFQKDTQHTPLVDLLIDLPVLSKVRTVEQYTTDLSPPLRDCPLIPCASTTDSFRNLGEKGTDSNFWDKLFGTNVASQILNDDLPPKEDLPQDIQDFLHDIESLPPEEKLHHIHEFVLDRMTYQTETNDPLQSLREVLNKQGKGDCDDYATLEFALLKYAGFEDDTIETITGFFDYESEHGAMRNLPHTAVIVRINGQPYLLDMNAESPVPLNPDMTGNGLTSQESENISVPIRITLHNPGIIIRGNGDMTIYDDNVKKLAQLHTPQAESTPTPPTQGSSPAP